MATFIISYSGSTTVEVEADTANEAESKFWEDCLNELADANIDAVTRQGESE